MTQQDTQPPAETLAECPFCGGSAQLMGFNAPEFWVSCLRIGCKAGTESFGSKERAVAAWNRRTSPALTRRAGGDAIPAGWQLVPIALPDEMAIAGAKGRQNSAISSFRDGWKYALAATPKPPAGGDAGAVEDAVVIRRNGAFFRPNAQGYTTHIAAAGIYSRREADAYSDVEGVTIHPLAEYRAEAYRSIEGAQRILAALAIPAPVVEGGVVAACGRIQKWMDDEHRTLAPGEAGAGLSYDDVTTVLRAALSEGRSHG